MSNLQLETPGIRMLEIGPGYQALCHEVREGEHHWASFEGSEYVAVQPPSKHYSKDIRRYASLPNVTVIEARAQSASLPENYFDEAFAANVMTDPGLECEAPAILEVMIRSVRSGGAISLLETTTAEDGYQLPAMMRDFCGAVQLRQAVILKPPHPGTCLASVTPEWETAVGPYSWIIRQRHDTNRQTQTGTFTQFTKV